MKYWPVFVFSLSLFVACSSDDDNGPKKNDFPAASFYDFLQKVEAIDSADRQELVDAMLDTLPSFPYISPDNQQVYFIYQSDFSIAQVALAGDMNGWNPDASPMTNLEYTRLWYRSDIFPSDARLDYKFVIGSSWILDPNNPNTVSGGFGPNSELAMPDYIQPWEIEKDEMVAEGTIEQYNLESRNTGKTYDVRVYLPPGYDEQASYPVAYFHDGTDYLFLGSAATVFDNLIDAGKIQPLIGVFVPPTDRTNEYATGMRFQYAAFFAEELVPFIDNNFATITDPASRAVIGASFGGNISAIISFTYPEVFGNCGIHSGAFQMNDFSTNDLVMEGVRKDIRVASIWGIYEGLYFNMRDIRDYLIDTNYDVYWKELPEGHSWGLWRSTTDDMLEFFFPATVN